MQYYLGDALGSVRQISDESGELLLTQSFDPYGGILAQEGSTQSVFGYTGEQTDPSGLVFLRARYYSTEQGRFITEDPFGGSASMPSTLNDYAYGVNNPILHTDPSGEIAPIIAAMIAGGVISGGFELVSQLMSNSGNFHCLDWTSIGIAVGAGAIGGLFCFFSTEMMVAIGISGLVGAVLTGGFGVVAFGIGVRTTETAFSGNWDNWRNEIFSPQKVATDFGMGASTSFLGYSVKSVFSTIKKSINDAVRQKLISSSLPEYSGGKTQGILDSGDDLIELISGWEGPAKQMPPKSHGFNIVTRTHVEGHASALMHIRNLNSATLYINNIPCTSCTKLLPRMLPSGSSLRIIVPNSYDRIFIGIVK